MSLLWSTYKTYTPLEVGLQCGETGCLLSITSFGGTYTVYTFSEVRC